MCTPSLSKTLRSCPACILPQHSVVTHIIIIIIIIILNPPLSLYLIGP
ncbi:hypothetical protein E2C01_073857 [Portunus trituberculatus]|uniref:Uncharacterized protein n=1 Tax=Portunus trituberculatus TaxID=210409 RepID=A0A5B7IAU3_PORTR|nr:hypothetical protein [Portunus trituberculatus]